MMWPFPGEGDAVDPFQYMTNRRVVEIYAKDQAEADAKFMERFGYAPTEDNRVK